jgi:hypothetical protein
MTLLISVSIQFTYLIYENTFLDWTQSSANNAKQQLAAQSAEMELIDAKNEDIYPDVKKLPFGSLQDCIEY